MGKKSYCPIFLSTIFEPNLEFSYETETLRQINYRVLEKGCIISRICFKSHINQTQLPIRKLKSFNTIFDLYKKK